MSERAYVKAKETSSGLKVKWRVGDGHEYEVIDFQNYFYVKEDDFNKEFVKKILKRYASKATIFVTSRNDRLVKIYLKDNFKRNEVKWKLQDKITLYESDITATKRWLIDNPDAELNFDALKVLYLDIETDDRKAFEKEHDGTVIAGTKQILSVAMADDFGKEWFFRNPDVDDLKLEGEKKLMKDMFEVISKHDIMTAWNSNRFDLPYIQQRQDSCGMQWDFSWHFINKFDEMEKYKKGTWVNHISFSLMNIASHELSEGKIDFSDAVAPGRGRFYRLWKEQPELLKEYNLKDVQLLRDMEKKLQLYGIHRTIAKIARCPIEDTMYNSHTCDYMTLNIYKRKGLIAKSKPTPLEKEALEEIKIGGGYTFCFLRGFFEDLEIFDYKSEYPLVILTYNISDETFVKASNIDFDEVKTFMDQKYIDFMKFSEGKSNRDIANYIKGKNKLIDDFEKLKNEELELEIETKSTLLEFIDERTIKVKKDVEEFIKIHKIDKSLDELMWIFVENYVGHKYVKYAKENNLIFTPADFNNDTNGWHFHPHRFYLRDEQGAFPEISDFVLKERDKAKYKLWEGNKKDPHFHMTPEGKRLNMYQLSVKTVGNSLYGFTGLKISRFFNFHIADAITTAARWQMKKSIIFAKKCGYTVTNGDTDSVFQKSTDKVVGDINDMNVAYYEHYDELFKPYNTNLKQEVTKPLNGEQVRHNKKIKDEIKSMIDDANDNGPDIGTGIEIETLEKQIIKPIKEVKSYYCVFEHEKTFKSIIVVAKKRYYFLTPYGDVETQGGAFKKRDTNPLAAKLQKELVTDILKKEYDRQTWIPNLTEWKNKTFDYKLDQEFLVFTKGYTKHWSEFGGPMIDKKTGEQKKTKDGRLRFKSIGAHIKLIRRLDEAGQLKIEPGDAIQYIIGKPLLNNVRILREKAARNKHGDDKIDVIVKNAKAIFKSKPKVEEEDFKIIQNYADNINIKLAYDYESTQRAITLKEFEDGEPYDTYKYWGSIISPILEILNVTDSESISKEYLNCWNYSENQLKRIVKSIEEEAESEPEDQNMESSD